MARYGFPRTALQIKEAVKCYLDKSKIKVKQFTDNRPGKSWFYGFLRRHPRIKLGKAEKLEQSRAMACTKESVYAWFDQFETFCRENNINTPDQIYNCDESGFPMQTALSSKVCCDRTIRRNFQVASNSKTSITTLQCICANGSVVPPAIIFPGVNFNPEYSIGFPKNFYLGFTKNGWMETSQFYGWITNHFVKQIPAMRPIVLLIDGHASHIDYHTSLFCKENQILLYRFPPHTSHALQPTDRGFFGAFKSNFSKEVARFTVEHPGVSITKRIFPTVFTRSYDVSCRADVVKSSFKSTGIYPLNRMNVDHGLFTTAMIYRDAPEEVDFSTDNANSESVSTMQENDRPVISVVDTPLISVITSANTSASTITCNDSISAASLNFSSITCESQHKAKLLFNTNSEKMYPSEIPESNPTSTTYDPPEALANAQANISNTVPGGAIKAIQNSPFKSSSPKTDSVHPVLQGLRDLEKSLGNKKHLYLNRHIEGYDVPGDALYNAWKTLYTGWIEVKNKISEESFSSKSVLEEGINPIINSILRYPEIERNQKKKNKKQDIPKHMSSQEALDILKLQEEEKVRAELAKEARRQSKIAKGNSKPISVKKRKANPTTAAEKYHPDKSKSNTNRKSTRRVKRRKKFDDFYSTDDESEKDSESYNESDNLCGKCTGEFVEGELWLQCDTCETWFHVACTDQRKKKKVEVDCLLEWDCLDCRL